MAGTGNADQLAFWNSAPGEAWARHQADLDLLHGGATDLLLAAARPAAGERALDVGCGAGASTFAIAACVGSGGEVLGIDFSAPLLELAERRRVEADARNVRFRRADAEVERFAAGTFDLVASRFGMMFFADPVAAFRNIGSGLRPGGRIAFVAWQGPERNPWFRLPQSLAVARLGEVAPTPPEAPGPMAFRDPGRVLGILAAAGFADADAELVPADLHHPGGVAAAVALATRVGPISRTLREKAGTEEDRAAIAEDLAVAFERYRSADGIRVPAGLIVFTARRP